MVAMRRVLGQCRRMELRLSPVARPLSGAPSRAKPLLVEARCGETLSRAIWLSGMLRPLPLCGGLGRCGRCRARFAHDAPAFSPDEESVLSPEELAAGWRLTCRHAVPDSPANGIGLELPEEDFAEAQAAAPCAAGELALAVDLGTTSLCWAVAALDSAEDCLIAEGHCLNPQAGAGADVVSRLAVASGADGRARLARLVRRAVRGIVEECGACGGNVRRICLAANTAMTAIFLDRDVSGLCAAPYRTECHGHETAFLPDLPPIYIPPLPGPFVGGDVSAGLAWLMANAAPRPLVLADLGTNGELALLMPDDTLLFASVPLGPALEGIGPACGCPAAPEVVTRFELGAEGLEALSPDGRRDGVARGISATGYLSLLGILRRCGVLDASGLFTGADALSLMPLSRRVAGRLDRGRGILPLPRGLRLEAGDVETFLKVKAAFALALEALLDAGRVRAGDLRRLCVAGALGGNVQAADLAVLGFVPACLEARVHPVGNASLAGAALLARRPELAPPLAELCAGAEVLSLVDAPDFQDAYLHHMRFAEW